MKSQDMNSRTKQLSAPKTRLTSATVNVRRTP